MRDVRSGQHPNGRTSQSEDIYRRDVASKFFRQRIDGTKDQARSILVDTEPKVVNRIVSKAKKQGHFNYSEDNVYLQKRGSGNNWAYGFNKHGQDAIDDVMGLCRKEVESCDRFGGFLVLMSMAGGTGSGLGTHLTSDLHDRFPRKFILNQVVLPYSSGEVILQNYNAILTLGHLYNTSDAVSIFENDQLSKVCQKSLGIKSVEMDHMNSVAAHKLASVLQPSLHHRSSLHSPALWQSTLGDLIESLCLMPKYKLLSIQNTPHLSENSMAYSTHVWPALLKHLYHMLITTSPVDEGIDWEVKPPPSDHSSKWKFSRSVGVASFNKSLANHLVLRGIDLHQADTSSFLSRQLYPPWAFGTPCRIWSQSRPFMGYTKSATVISNSQGHIRSLDSIVRKAWNMFSSRAYIHQYLQCGMQEDEFVESFAAVEQILSDYRAL